MAVEPKALLGWRHGKHEEAIKTRRRKSGGKRSRQKNNIEQLHEKMNGGKGGVNSRRGERSGRSAALSS
uniref:Small hydrophilic protein n=1 Tax=Steinernema glaseri TaxID=37863 RepID=A0A1I7YNT2_9BILA